MRSQTWRMAETAFIAIESSCLDTNRANREAAIAGIPASVPLERASEVHLTDAGGGALQWVLHAPSTNWSLQATMWPGSLHLFVHDADDDEEQLYRARATRTQDYYLRKYPID